MCARRYILPSRLLGEKQPLTIFHSGSNVIVAGTAIFNDPHPENVIQSLKNSVNSAQAKIAERQQ